MKNKDLKIRPVRENEIQILSTIASQTFFDTYAAFNTMKDMEHYLSENFSHGALRAQLENPDSFFYFAELDKAIVGYIKLNKGTAQTDSKLENALEIERIYVVNNFQGMKIGNQLVHRTIELARSLGSSAIWLGVWDRNVKAIEFYLKSGFVEFAQHTFIIGTDPQNDVLMKFDLT